MGIDDVIGQKGTWQRLTTLVKEDRLPHALLLTGPQGCGTFAMAVSLAEHIIGRSPFAYPDMHFTYPTIKTASMSADYKPISPDFAQQWRTMVERSPYFTMETWSEAIGAEKKSAIITAGESEYLTSKLTMRSATGGYKLSLIWLPERMNSECANKLLKLIEEPPEKTLFLLVSDEPERLLETIRSRCQRIDMPRIDDADMRAALVNRRGLSDDDAERIARMAAGNWIAAVEILSASSERQTFLAHFQALMRQAYQRDIRSLKGWAETLAAYDRDKQKRFLTYTLRLLRENFVYNLREPQLNYMTVEEETFATRFARFIHERNIIPITELAERAIRDISQNANSKIVFFDIAVQMILLLKE